MKTKWVSPTAWLHEHLEELSNDDILEIAHELAHTITDTTIENMFRNEMDEDGYYDDPEPEPKDFYYWVPNYPGTTGLWIVPKALFDTTTLLRPDAREAELNGDPEESTMVFVCGLPLIITPRFGHFFEVDGGGERDDALDAWAHEHGMTRATPTIRLYFEKLYMEELTRNLPCIARVTLRIAVNEGDKFYSYMEDTFPDFVKTWPLPWDHQTVLAALQLFLDPARSGTSLADWGLDIIDVESKMESASGE